MRALLRALLGTLPPLRRQLEEQAQLRAENAALQSRLDSVQAQGYWMRHHPYAELGEEAGHTTLPDSPDPNDRAVIDRLVSAYRRNADPGHYGDDSMWKGFHDGKQRELDTLLRHGAAAEIAEAVRNPQNNHLMLGFETINRESGAKFAGDLRLQRERADRFKDALVRLAEALGVLRVENPEGGPWLENTRMSADQVLDLIEGRLGIELAVPWCYAGFYGLNTRRGVFGHRMINAAYCAWRIRQLCAGCARPRVLEIGAGLGHLARYAHLMGIRDYTIVDLPLTNVSQAYFLMRTLGEDAVALEGEPDIAAQGRIKVMSPRHLQEVEGRYDLVVNVDSMTEFGRVVAAGYLRRIFAHADTLLSINHEANPFTVNELLQESFPRFSVQRFPYWLRNGYVEEVMSRI